MASQPKKKGTGKGHQPDGLVAYLRVSTTEQAEKGSGLDVQREKMTEWADAHGYVIVEWFADEGVSGSNGLDTRPGIFEAMSALARADVSGLIVAKLDRLARSLALQETLLAQVERAGAQMFSADDAENEYLNDDDEPTRRLIRQVLGAVAEWERGMITARMKAGRAQRAKQGAYAYGAPPYGWTSVTSPDGGKRLAPVESEQTTLRRLRELRDEGASTRRMAEVLAAEGHRTRKGGAWYSANIARLLKRLDEVPAGALDDGGREAHR